MSLDKVFSGWRDFLKEDNINEASEEWMAHAENFMEQHAEPEDYPFNDVFDGKWRKVVPMGIGDPMALEVATQLRKEGYTIVNKMETVKQRLKIAGGGEKVVEEDRQTLFTDKDFIIPKGPKAGEKKVVRQKLGRTIRKEFGPDSPEYKWWEKNQTFYGEGNNYLQLTEPPKHSMIVSRHPYDVMRMSDFSWAGISSCHSEGGEYEKCVPGEVAGQGGVAWVVNTSDLENIGDLDDPEIFADPDRGVEGIAPISRHRLRRFDNDQDKDAQGVEGYSILVPDLVTYGKKTRGFQKDLKDWAYEAQVGKAFEKDATPRLQSFVSRGGSYFDAGSRPGDMFNSFFDPEEKPYQSGARMPHQREEEETEFVAGSNELAEMEAAVAENNQWAEQHLDHIHAHAEVEEIDHDHYYVLFSARMELEFPNIPYDPNDKWWENWRSRDPLERAISEALDDFGYPHPEETTISFHPNRRPGTSRLTEGAEDNLGRLDVDLSFSTENYEPSAEGFEEYVRDLSGQWDDENKRVKDAIHKILVEEEIVEPRPFDNLKKMIEDDEFPEFKYFEPHPHDESHELEFRLKPAVVQGLQPVARYMPRFLNDWLIKSFKALDSRLFAFTTPRDIEVAKEEGRAASTKQMPGLAGLVYSSPDPRIVGWMVDRVRLAIGGNHSDYIPFQNVVAPAEMPKGTRGGVYYSEPFRAVMLARLKNLNEEAKDFAKRQLKLPFDKKPQGEFNFLDDYTHDEDDIVDDLDFDALGVKFAIGFQDTGDRKRANDNGVRVGMKLEFDGGMTELESKAAMAFMKYVDNHWDDIRRMQGDTMKAMIGHFEEATKLRMDTRWPGIREELEGLITKRASSIGAMGTTQLAAVPLPPGHPQAHTVRDPSDEEIEAAAIDQGRDVEEEVPTLRGTLGEPQPAQEAIVRNVMKRLGTNSPLIREALFKTLEKKLIKEKAPDPNYELRLFAIPVRVAISKQLGGDKTDTFNEIRGITACTVVRDIEGTAREDNKNFYSTLVIKFELLGGHGPLDYKTKELIPGLKSIKGMVVYNIGDAEEVRK